MNSNEKVITEIKNAFNDIKLGQGIGLMEANAMDDYANLDLRNLYRSKDEKENWENISYHELNKNYCGLSYFDAEGMRFHLPAFMIADLKGEFRFDLIFTLTSLSNNEQFRLLNRDQKQSVISYLLYMSEKPEYQDEIDIINNAISSYWSK